MSSGPSRYDVDMALEDQRAAGFGARAMNADDDRRGRMLGRKRAATGMGANLAFIHGEDIDRQTASAQFTGHQILRGVLIAPRRGAADEIGSQRKLSLEAIIDGFLNALL